VAGEIVHMEFLAGDVDRMTQTSPGCGAALYASEERGHPTLYFATDDIDASCAQVRELGGSAEDKSPVPTHGWFAACSDSEGNEFHLWQADPGAA
jgi:predicted enzyme related to lactoylglutathione lyase